MPYCSGARVQEYFGAREGAMNSRQLTADRQNTKKLADKLDVDPAELDGGGSMQRCGEAIAGHLKMRGTSGKDVTASQSAFSRKRNAEGNVAMAASLGMQVRMKLGPVCPMGPLVCLVSCARWTQCHI
jgi:hypothetical protein